MARAIPRTRSDTPIRRAKLLSFSPSEGRAETVIMSPAGSIMGAGMDIDIALEPVEKSPPGAR
tara:strand:+ start:438 stop:626 length:189 start_codon:yes stop_codon:yes gene_type:complete